MKSPNLFDFAHENLSIILSEKDDEKRDKLIEKFYFSF